MAAPATHIVLANKIYKKYFPNTNYSDYIIGNSFPDIRYLGKIDRDRTHYKNLDIGDISNESSFVTGVKLHSIVDEIREKYMRDNGIYELFPKSHLKSQSVKFYEDRVLYEKIDNWSKITQLFDDIMEEELTYSVDKASIQKWHNLLKDILCKAPNDKTLYEFALEINHPKSLAKEIIRVINESTQLDKAEKIILKFYDDFESLI